MIARPDGYSPTVFGLPVTTSKTAAVTETVSRQAGRETTSIILQIKKHI